MIKFDLSQNVRSRTCACGLFADRFLDCYVSFFFSSRRRHTRCLSDWSSDVCSSDLELKFLDYAQVAFVSAQRGQGTRQLFPMIRNAYESASLRVGTGELNRFVETLR